MNFELNIKSVISVILIIFLSLIIISHFFKGWFKLNPFYRNKILLEGFEMDTSGNKMNESSATPSTSDSAKEAVIPSANEPSANEPSANEPSANAPSTTTPASATATTPSDAKPTIVSAPATSANPTTATAPATPSASADSAMDTEKATIVADLFEKVNTQMDIIRTIRLSDKFVPINIDKTASEPFVILMNLKLLINNGIYKNEMDLRELYDKYMGNKAIQVITSDINSVNMDSRMQDIGTLETSFLSRCQSIVDGHQKIIDKILENKSKESV
jgi:hypothetical protein